MTLCQHCQQRSAQWACTRQVERYGRAYMLDLVPGDRICRTNEDPRSGVYATVVSVLLQPGSRSEPNPAKHVFDLTMLIQRTGRPDRTKVVSGLPLSTVRRASNVPCGVSLCDLCAQDPGDPHRYCPEHWTIRTLEMAA